MLNFVFKPHRTHLKSGTTDPQKVFAMLQVIPKAEIASARPPLAFALVVDTSGSMREFADQEKARNEIARRSLRGASQFAGEGSGQAYNLPHQTKADQAIQAAHAFLDDERLTDRDRVAVIHFDTDAHTLLPLSPLGNRQAAHQAVESLRDHSGQTYMAKGLSCALQELGDVPPQTAKRVLLLTDGNTYDEGKCRRLAGQFGESNTLLIALGIGEEYNQALLIELTNATNGVHEHLQSMAQFHTVLNQQIGTSVAEVVTDLQASVAMVKGVTLDSVTRVYPSLSEVGAASQPYRLGNIAAGDFTVFVLEFSVSGIARPPSRARIAQVSLTGNIPGLGRQDDIPPQDLFLTFTTDEAAIASVDPEVLGYVQQKNVDRLVQDAVRLATTDAARARQTLQAAVGMTQRVGNAGMTQMLQNALGELNKTGTISANTARTVRAGGRTKTMRTGGAGSLEGVPSEDEIRRLTGA